MNKWKVNECLPGGWRTRTGVVGSDAEPESDQIKQKLRKEKSKQIKCWPEKNEFKNRLQ